MTRLNWGATLAAGGLATIAIIAGPGSAAAQDHTASADFLTIEEWTVPYPDSRPRDPFVGPDGRVWFVGQAAHYAAVLDPATGEFTRYDMDDGTGPHNLIVDDDGLVYYAGNRANHIGIIDPATGAIDKIMMPDERARDPHTLIWDQNGDIWFSVQGGKSGRLPRQGLARGAAGRGPRGGDAARHGLEPSLRGQAGLGEPAVDRPLQHEPDRHGGPGLLRTPGL